MMNFIKIIINMMRILQKILGIAPREPQGIFIRRQHLKQRQKQNIQLTASLPSNPQLLELPLSQLVKAKGQQKFGSFVSRCFFPQHRQLNFLADMNIKKAQQINKQGVPFTVKDHLKVNDMVSTCGFSHNITPAYQNSQIEGCVPFAHTNVPQGLFNIQSGNQVWGTSLNPYKKQFISGGSSGGQAAAVATRCSAFGIASDSAGSSRIPAAYCGVVGYKPTGSIRLSRKGRLSASGQQRYLLKDLDVSMGFITRNVADLSWLCEKTLGKTEIYNPYILGKWDNQKFQTYKNKKLKFGYIIQDNQMKAVPAVKNCILQSIELLKKDGHEVIEFNFPELYKFRDFTFKVLNIAGVVKGVNMFLKEENQTRQTWWIHQRSKYGNIGSWIRKLLATSPHQKKIYDNFISGNSFLDLVRACQHKDLIKAQFLKAWQKSGIDALITPVTPFTAPMKNSNQFLLYQLTFCGFPNVLEMPSGTLPIRKVKKEETIYQDMGFYQSKIANSIKQSQGLPVGIQLTAAHMQDEVCIAAMQQLERLLPKIEPPQNKI